MYDFIETDDLQQFVTDGGRREIRYMDGAFVFGYEFQGRNGTFLLHDTVTDPSTRERDVLMGESAIIQELRALANA